MSFENGRITFSAAAGESNIVGIGVADGIATIHDVAGGPQPGAGCQAQSDGNVRCPAPEGSILQADLGDGDDTLTMSGTLPMQVDGGPGNDIISGGPADEVLRGGAGDDKLLGGGGNDTLIAAAGNDTLTGDAGDDTLQAGDGNDSLDGGGGNDTLTAGAGDDTLAGGDGNDRLEAGKGVDALDAGGGNDVLLSAEGEFTGTREKSIACGAGDDRLTTGPADPFVSDCEQTDGASLRLRKGGRIPLALSCVSACNGSVRIAKIKSTAPVRIGAGKTGTIQVRLSARQIAKLFRKKKVRLTGEFTLGGAQRVRATFTLLRRV